MVFCVDIENASELDAFVAAQPGGHVMQTSLWGRVKKDWRWQGLLLRNPDGSVRASMALLIRRLRHYPACLLYAPRGPVFAPGDTDAFLALVRAAKDCGRRLGAYALRLDPEIPEEDAAFAALARRIGFRIDAAEDYSLFQPRLCYVLDMAGRTEETLPELYRRSTRYNVRHALKGPLTLRFGGEEDLPAFCAMMGETAARHGFAPRQAPYFRALLEGLGDCARLWLAETEGRAVAAAITVCFGGTCSLLYSCSDAEGQRLHANELIQYRAQADALGRGCTRYDFRGVEGRPTEENPAFGLHSYKQGFGADFRAWIGQMDLPLRPFVYSMAQRFSHRRSAPYGCSSAGPQR